MRTSPDEPERRCILSGEHGTRVGLIRLALGPDGQVAPDLQARAGGRGAWIGVARGELEAAQRKGRLRGALLRAFRAKAITVPDDLGALIEAGLMKAAMDRLGLENRAGALIFGTERIAEALAADRARLLIVAADAGADGATTLAAKARTANVPKETMPCGREALSNALGRANVVYLGVSGVGAAERIATAVSRWRDFSGFSNGGGGGLAAALPSVAAVQGQV